MKLQECRENVKPASLQKSRLSRYLSRENSKLAVRLTASQLRSLLLTALSTETAKIHLKFQNLKHNPFCCQNNSLSLDHVSPHRNRNSFHNLLTYNTFVTVHTLPANRKENWRTTQDLRKIWTFFKKLILRNMHLFFLNFSKFVSNLQNIPNAHKCTER